MLAIDRISRRRVCSTGRTCGGAVYKCNRFRHDQRPADLGGADTGRKPTGCSWSGSALWATGIVFDAPIHANLGLGMTVTSPPAGSLFVNLYGPTGMPVGAASASGTNSPFDLLELSTTSRYLIEMSTGGSPDCTPSGNVSFWLSSDLTGTLTPSSSVTYTSSASYSQNGRYAPQSNYAAQHDSCFTSRSNVCAASFNPSTIVR